MPQPATAEAKLDDFGIDALCDHLIEGGTFRDLSQKLGVARASIYRWISLDADRSARVQAARVSSALDLSEEALVILKGKQYPIDRAREIASHLRWEAKVRNPQQFGEKVQVDQNVTQHASQSEAQLLERMKTLEALLAQPLPPLPVIEDDTAP